MRKSFEQTKESLGRALIALCGLYSVELLIAGNCFCDICENILDVSLEWHDHDPFYLATAAVLYKKMSFLQMIKKGSRREFSGVWD